MSVPGEPDGGEVAPAELGLNNVAPIFEGVTNLDGVVASFPVIVGALVLRRVVADVVAIVGHGERESGKTLVRFWGLLDCWVR